MKDTTIIRMAEEVSKALSDAHPFCSCPRMLPSYNALLQAAKANHPSDTFFSTLSVVDSGGGDEITVAELRALLAQLRIALESFEEDRR